ncbi:MAG: PqqD family peptide modification chaperone [Oligoflexia bacterium]|nr:PqqD family peptide modification chaperone [Oligoflexia bacterium]
MQATEFLVQRASDTLAAPLAEGRALLDVKQGMYFGLDLVGGRIWELLSEPIRFSEIATAIVNEFEVERAVAEADIRAFLEELQRHNLVRTTPV